MPKENGVSSDCLEAREVWLVAEDRSCDRDLRKRSQAFGPSSIVHMIFPSMRRRQTCNECSRRQKKRLRPLMEWNPMQFSDKQKLT